MLGASFFPHGLPTGVTTHPSLPQTAPVLALGVPEKSWAHCNGWVILVPTCPPYLLDAEVEAPWALLGAGMPFPPESFVPLSRGARSPRSRAPRIRSPWGRWLMLSGPLFS